MHTLSMCTTNYVHILYIYTFGYADFYSTSLLTQTIELGKQNKGKCTY